MNKNFVFALIVAMVTSFYLFYIDEGSHNLHWMKNIGNWIMYVVYVIVSTSFQWGIAFLLNYFSDNKLNKIAYLLSAIVFLAGVAYVFI